MIVTFTTFERLAGHPPQFNEFLARLGFRGVHTAMRGENDRLMFTLLDSSPPGGLLVGTRVEVQSQAFRAPRTARSSAVRL
jgi:hypothetical protein